MVMQLEAARTAPSHRKWSRFLRLILYRLERGYLSLSFSLSFSFWFLFLFHTSFIFLDPGNSSKEGEIDAVSEDFIESRIIPILLEFSFQIHSISQDQHIVFKYLDKLKMDNNRLKWMYNLLYAYRTLCRSRRYVFRIVTIWKFRVP